MSRNDRAGQRRPAARRGGRPPDEGRSETSPLEVRVLEELGISRDARAESSAIPGRRLAAEIAKRLARGRPGALDLPVRIGDVELRAPLGSGGMGVVYRGRHLPTGRSVAVKVAARGTEEARALEREAASLARINDPHVVKVVATGSDSGLHWLAEDLVEGETLASLLRKRRRRGAAEEPDLDFDELETSGDPERGPRTRGDREIEAPSEDEILECMGWMRDLARTLDAIDRAGLVHRDVTPRNIVVGPGRIPVLLDFGLAVEDALDVRGSLAGTIPYMSPEHVTAGYTGLDVRSDLYSLAACFHEFLTGRRVVGAHSTGRASALLDILNLVHPPPSRCRPGLPASLDPIFARALQKDPRRRPESGEELARLLEDWSAARTKRRPLLLAAVAVAALGLGLLGAHFAERWQEGRRESRALERLLATAGDHRRAGRFEAGLSLLAPELATHREHEGFLREYELLATGAARGSLDRMLAHLAFAAPGRDEGAPWREGARAAEVHLEVCPHPAFALQAALLAYLEARPRDGLAVLERHAPLIADRRASVELRALLHGQAEDWAGLRDDLALLRSAEGLEEDAAGVCLQALRVVRCRHWSGFPTTGVAVGAEEVSAARARLSGLLSLHPDHQLALTLLALLDVGDRDWESALRRLEAVQLAARDVDEGKVLLWRLRCALALSGDERSPRRDDAVLYARRLENGLPEFGGRGSVWLARRIAAGEVPPEAGLFWLETLAGPEHAGLGRPEAEEHELALVVGYALFARASEDDAAHDDLAAAVRASAALADRLDGPWTDAAAKVESYLWWHHLYRLRDALEKADRGAARGQVVEHLAALEALGPAIDELDQERRGAGVLILAARLRVAGDAHARSRHARSLRGWFDGDSAMDASEAFLELARAELERSGENGEERER